VEVVVSLLEAKLEILGPLAAAKGDVELELPRPPNGEALELEKAPKPEDLNLSVDVCCTSSLGFSVAFEVGGGDARAANGDAAEVLAKPLVGEILSKVSMKPSYGSLEISP
jgi:hypothetical protein